MAIEPISAEAPSYLNPVIEVQREIQRVEGSLLRVTESTLSVEALVLSDSVDISDTSRLLSAVSEIADAATTAADGGAIDPREVAADAQRFVDSVNALNLGTQFETGGLFDSEAQLPVAPGLDTIPLAGEDSFLLTLDSEALETALEDAPALTSSALAAAVVPLGTELAAQAVQTELAVTQGAGNVLATDVVISQTDLLTLSAEAGLEVGLQDIPVVPDLTVSNAELRQALADALLADALNPTTSLPPVTAPVLTLPPLLQAEGTTPPSTVVVSAEATQTVDAELPAESADRPTQTQALVNTQNLITTPEQAVLAATTATEAQATLTAEELITTPLEQITRLALNPTVAGAVAAFQIAGDDGGRAAKVTLQSDADVVNSVAAILATEGITSNLASSSEQR